MVATILTTEQINALANLTTRDHRGRHFTETSDPTIIELLESLGAIEIYRPVHAATGIPYSQEYWTVSVTDLGQDVVDRHYDPRDDPQAE